MTSDEMAQKLDKIGLLVGDVLEACDEYGGWAGHDDDAKRATEIGYRLMSVGWTVGLYGREVAELGVDTIDPTVTWGDLYDTAVVDFAFDAGLFKVIPIPQNKSERIYIGGEVFDCDDLRTLAVEEGDPKKYDTLIAKVTHWREGEGFVETRAIRCHTGNWQPYEGEQILTIVER